MKRKRNHRYLRAVRALGFCVAGSWGPCEDPIEAHHAGKNPGVGMKAPDETAVPICRRHHRHITGIVGGYGDFGALTADNRRTLQDFWVARIQRELSANLTGNGDTA